ncbi:MAG: glycosyltransferase family 4 protein [Anaerolineales bacterium]|nr:glycosyltransferase family 4 protein [Anaerolineales bacterium]
MPHVALNAHLLFGRASYRSAGIHQYIANLLPHLPAAAPEFDFTVFVGAGEPNLPRGQVQRSRLPTQRPAWRILWEQAVQPLALWRARPDLIHGLAFALPLAYAGPAVVTVYDLSFLVMPEKFPPAQRLYLRTITGLSCRRARRVIAISESTRADVARRLGVDPARIDVACPGLQPHFRPLPAVEVEAFRARAGLPARFILYLGTLEPRKNLVTLLQAFARLRSGAPDLHLVIAGARGWLYAELFRQVQALDLAAVVHFPGFVPAEDLPLWYNAAAVFAYPSSFEGFGMPVLEALACGRPVVTSNVSSLPEAAGEAALLAPPSNAAALADAMRQALAEGPDRGARGPGHAARFTWAATAAQTAAAYRQALAAGR